MSAPSLRPPLINRPLVGLLAIVGLVGGVSLIAFDSFDSAWGASLLRVGVFLAVFWIALAPAKNTTPRSPVSSWLTMAIAGFALAAMRSRKPGLMMVVGIVFAAVAFVVKPRKK